ncbi:biotin--[acetyl-CoA-carboxylase] ligase [Salisaeta longa]|uniref:biotin--[acetyl-CoA-carboxylase] ligase n=1 Tax=Salisaeta longa TaxID=503170 RepID=UPI0003B33CFD|nr:biotin--[acetyl-CoA-carboxylase] ligase [Salisaeta longa]
MRLADELASVLQTHTMGRTVRAFETIGSTNTEAAAWARNGAPEGALVLTNFQTAGRGRQGRPWTAQAGVNLMGSLVLYPDVPPDAFGRLTLAAAVAVAEAIAPVVAPYRPTIKWPNDILLEGKKCCGVLLETSLAGAPAQRPPAVILGLGLNVNQVDFPAALAERATSLRLVTGRTVARAPLLARLLKRFEELYTTAADEVQTRYVQRMAHRGETLTVRFAGSDRTCTGRVLGITATGALRLRTPSGEKALHAGEVTTQAARSAHE